MHDKNTDSKAIQELTISKLSGIKNLPSIPFILHEVSDIIENPYTSASQLGTLISKDQGLSTKILSIANSPFYGLPRKVSTIDFAIVILGFEHIKNVVIALSLIETFKGENNKNWNKREFTKHSLITAFLAKKIASDLGFYKSGEAFTAGLLHDLGVTVINKFFKTEYEHILYSVKEDGLSYLEAELLHIGFTHCDIAKYLCEKWNLPATLANALKYHHNPSESEIDTFLPSIIHVTDYITKTLQLGDFFWDENYQFDPKVIEILKLGDEEYLESFTNSYKQSIEKNLEIISVL